MAVSAAEPLLHARRLRARYHLARDHPAPERVRAKLDAATGAVLRDVLASALFEHFAPADETIWFIRRLDIDLAVNADWDRDVLARVWAATISRALADAITAGPDGVNVVRFSSRAHHVAHFLRDVAEERAWSQWYHQGFAGLRHVTQSSAIRTVVLQELPVGLEALCLLEARTLVLTLGALTQQDARAILAAWSPPGSEAVRASDLLLGWRAYRGTRARVRPDGELQAALQICIEALRLDPESRRSGLVAAVRAITRLASLMETDPAIGPAIVRILRENGPNALHRVVGISDVPILAPLAEADSGQVQEIVKELLDRQPTARSIELDGEKRSTPFGGAFLLFPLLADLPFDSAAESLPGIRGTPAASLARLVVLAKMLGGASLPRLLMDPVMMQLLGMPSSLRLNEILVWLQSLPAVGLRTMQRMLIEAVRPVRATPSRSVRRDLRYLELGSGFAEPQAVRRAFGHVALTMLRNFAWRLPGFAQASFAHLRTNVLDAGATVESQLERYVVRIARPPLDIVLTMTGLSRATYRLPWLPGRTIALFPEEAI